MLSVLTVLSRECYICIDMSKKLLWILAGVMAIVMTGLILVQTYWISNAFRIKEKQFAQLVARSMSGFSTVVENREAAYFLNQFLFPGMDADTTGSGGLYFNYHEESHSSLDPYNPRDFHYDQQITIQNQDGKKAAKKDGIRIRVNNDSLTVRMPGKSGFRYGPDRKGRSSWQYSRRSRDPEKNPIETGTHRQGHVKDVWPPPQHRRKALA